MLNWRQSLNWFWLCTIISIFYLNGCSSTDKPFNLQSVKKQVESGGDINQRDERGYSPLMVAAYYNSHEIVVYLLENGADINLQGKDGYTALMLATINMNTRMVKTLLKYHPDVNLKDNDGYTALYHARNLNLKSISSLLEKSGAK